MHTHTHKHTHTFIIISTSELQNNEHTQHTMHQQFLLLVLTVQSDPPSRDKGASLNNGNTMMDKIRNSPKAVEYPTTSVIAPTNTENVSLPRTSAVARRL